VDEKEPATREELVRHLEKLTGRTLKTREDIQAFVREAAERKARDEPAVRRWVKFKRITLIALLAFGLIQYYIIDVLLQIASLRTNTYFVPAGTRVLKSMIATLAA
jgi:hypothetical protein